MISSVTSFAATVVFPSRRNILQQSIGSSSLLSLASDDSNTNQKEQQQEDLELTRQIILNYINRKEKGTEEHEVEAEKKEDSSEQNNLAGYLERPINDNMIRVALGEITNQTPIWLFRQAGRHLPEYHTYKGTKSFLDLLSNPIDVAECTLQPVRRYNLDAAILFSDILVIVEALNIQVTMPGGVGIQIPEPLLNPNDMYTRLPTTIMNHNEANIFVQNKLKHVLDAVKLIRINMKNENISIPLIGFSAAPYTLLYYMVGGSSKKNNDIGMKWLKEYPNDSTVLLQLLTQIIIEYLSLQIENGVHMIQIFEAMGMMINDDLFEEYGLPCLQQIGIELKKRYNNTIPIMIFTRGKCNERIIKKLLEYNCFDVITFDGSLPRDQIRQIIAGKDITIQGNYDPAELVDDGNKKTIESVQDTAKQYLYDLGPQRLIANLGEGLGGKESPILVNAFIDAIHDISSTMIAETTTSTPISTSTTSTSVR